MRLPLATGTFESEQKQEIVSAPIFTAQSFKFLEELKDNNTRLWFNANKERYIEDVRESLSKFIVEMQAPLANISQHLVADPRPVGGSMFRIYRDTRFSKDKTPYKTHAAVHFRHSVDKDVHGPGLYFHMGPEENSVGGGIWHPETVVVRRIRQYIVDHSEQWVTIKDAPDFVRAFGSVRGDALKRVPREFDSDHPLADDLRLKDFWARHDMSRKDVTSSNLVAEMTRMFETLSRFMAFLAKAVGLPW